MPDPRDYLIGIDIGVTNVKHVCVMRGGEIVQQDSTPTNAQSDDWPSGIARLVEDIEEQRGPANAIGLACPGIASPDASRVFWMQGRLQAVEGLNWTEFFKRERPVPVLNDAQAALMGEAWLGAARGSSNAIMLTLGTGVGGAAMVDGRLLRGNLGRAGHLGHLSLNPDGLLDIVNTPGSLEDAIGNCTIRQRTSGRFDSTHDLISAHRGGDAEATRVWLRSIRMLAAGIASLINICDPEVVIIGGGIAGAGAALFEPLERELVEFEWRPHGRRVRLVPAALGEFAGAIGAARNAVAQASSL